jgi:hypothetical protein
MVWSLFFDFSYCGQAVKESKSGRNIGGTSPKCPCVGGSDHPRSASSTTDAAIGAIGVIGAIGGRWMHENFLRKLVRMGAGHPTEPPCVGTVGLPKVYALRAR